MRLAVYAASNQGVRVVDFRDPENPKEIAYYVKERHIAENAPPPSIPGLQNFITGRSTPVTGTDFTRPDPRYDLENCFWYTGWNQGGLVSLELTNPEYSPCLRRAVNGGGWLAPGENRINFGFEAARADSGYGGLEGALQLNDRAAGAKIHIDALTLLGSPRDQCGSVPARANSVQFDGTGTHNGAPASFRVCVQDNGQGKNAKGQDRFHLVCTAGCDYTADGAISGGNIEVLQR